VAAGYTIKLKDLEIINTLIREVEFLFFYKSGFLVFREVNTMMSTMNGLKRNYDIVMIDGHDVLHPRGFGLASQVDMIIDKTNLGVAKRLIVRSHIVEGNHFPELLLFKMKLWEPI
jgi:deoxyinosine 3'endonuclease (endonuclease V)